MKSAQYGIYTQLIETFDSILERTGLGSAAIPNRGQAPDSVALQVQLPQVVEKVKTWIREKREAFEARMRPELNRRLASLAQREGRHVEQLELKVGESAQAESFKQARLRQESERIRSRFEEYRHWINDTMNTEDQPYIQIVAALVNQA